MKQTKSNHKVGRVIIVDDEAELMTVLCEILTGHGYETVGCTSAAEALAKLKEQDFDLLLTDLMMPEMGGIELLQAAREIDPDIVGIVMTGQGTVQTAVEAMKTGAFDYIMKPFTLNSLLPVLSRAMEVRHLRADNMQLRETVAMHELGQALAFSSDLNQILNKVIDAVLQQCDADEASIMLPTSDGKELIIAAARGGHAEQIGKRIPMGQGIAGWVAQNLKTATLNGEVHDERFTSINPRADIRAAVSIPLLVGGSLVGVLNVNITRPHRRFTLGQVKTLNILVSIVSPILENARLYAEKKRAEDLYRTLAEDSLTVVFIVQDGKFRFISAAIASVGYSVEELIGRHFDAIIHPEDREMVKKRGREVLRGEHTTPYVFRMVTKQGQIRWLMQIVSPILYEGRPAILGNAVDVTERKQAEEALRLQDRTFSEVLNSLDALVYVIDMNTYEILFINAYGQNIWGDIKGKICWQTIQEGQAGPCEFCTNSQLIGTDGNPTKGVVWEFLNTVNKRWYDCRDKAIYWPDGRIARMEIATDITDRKQAEETLRRSEEKYRDIFDNIVEGIYRTTPAGRFLILNPAFARICGYASPEEMMEKVTDIANQLYVNPEDRLRFQKFMAAEGEVKGFDVQFKHQTKGLVWVSINSKALHDEQGNIQYYDGTIEDNTERKQAAEALRESEEKYRTIIENMEEGYYEVDIKGNFTFFNETMRKFLGYEREELSGMNNRQYLDEENARKVYQVYNRAYRTGETVKNLEWQVTRKDGDLRDIEVSISLIRNGEGHPTGFRGIARDNTERKQAEEALRQAEERYRNIFENAQEGIFQTTYEGQYLAANRALATILGYDSPEDLMTTVIDIPTQLYVNPEVRKVLLKMIEEQGPVMGFETQFYRKDGSIIWVSVNQHAVRDAGGRVLHYEGFNEDITMKKDSIERMKKALWATVQAIAVTVETRDPYTAGHQRRVADLARAIAMEMNLPTDQIDGIRMAAIIHDLGKISVPAEILSKPSKLTDLEFGIIKTHAQSGYDILKDIEFPWPIARMILEHHERMDGSGYPRNLKGDDILMEARIMAVADVVESMASHRPYRPALGIDAALEEIENNRGTHYDTSTVDACLRIFRENGFKLDGIRISTGNHHRN